MTVGVVVVTNIPPADQPEQWRNKPVAATAMHGLSTLLVAVPAAAAAVAEESPATRLNACQPHS